MKNMKPIHYICLILILAATAMGMMLIMGKVTLPAPAEKVQMQEAAAATEATAAPQTQTPTEAPTEAPTEPPTEPPTEAPTEPQPEHFTLTFVGDCTLGCNAKMAARKSAFPQVVGTDYDYPMKNVRSIFVEDDYSFANLEGVLGDKGSARSKKFVFRGSAEYTEIFTRNGVEGVTLANNHALDYGQEALDETKRILGEAGIDYVDHLQTMMVTTDSGLTIGVFSADFNRGTPKDEQIIGAIQKLKEDGAEFIVCAFHWGRENTFQATKGQKAAGQLAIDAGANFVWGHHPHVLQPIEVYNGGVICYSLGNFVFGGNSDPKDHDTAIVQQEVIRQLDGSITMGDLTVIPCTITSEPGINNFQPTLFAEGTKEYDRVLTKLGGTYKGKSLPIG